MCSDNTSVTSVWVLAQLVKRYDAISTLYSGVQSANKEQDFESTTQHQRARWDTKVNKKCAEIVLMKHMLTFFSHFPTHLFESFPHGRQGPVNPLWLKQWLQITWWCISLSAAMVMTYFLQPQHHKGFKFSSSDENMDWNYIRNLFMIWFIVSYW